MKNQMKHFLSIVDAKDHIDEMLDSTGKFKKNIMDRELLKGKTLAMIFEKASTRTRISFEVAMFHLGGSALYLSTDDLQIGRGEIIEDTAKAMSRYVNGVMIRARKHEDVAKFAHNSDVPVINGLTDIEHPCQALADIFTIYERKKSFDVHLTFVGDGNNVCNSLLLASSLVGMDMVVVCPSGYEPPTEIFEEAKKFARKSGSNLKITNDLEDGIAGSDIIYTDVWVSMGDEKESKMRIKAFKDYQVNIDLLNQAADDVIVMHCLPAHRGQEITASVIDGEHSIVWDQAENRLHAQKAVLYKLLG